MLERTINSQLIFVESQSKTLQYQVTKKSNFYFLKTEHNFFLNVQHLRNQTFEASYSGDFDILQTNTQSVVA